MAQAIHDAKILGFSGSENTPFILKRIRELTNGTSVTANRALVEANVIRGTKVAVELQRLTRMFVKTNNPAWIEPQGNQHM